ncbi:hypothetical protein J6590_031524 [Homalodisca vitripennis]|nr:hypothetical protein J6590_031524 [Homalodisca vitripennis]
MFRSPQQLRCGSKGQVVPLSAGGKRKTARSLSTPELSVSPESSAPVKTTKVTTDVEAFVDAYLPWLHSPSTQRSRPSMLSSWICARRWHRLGRVNNMEDLEDREEGGSGRREETGTPHNRPLYQLPKPAVGIQLEKQLKNTWGTIHEDDDLQGPHQAPTSAVPPSCGKTRGEAYLDVLWRDPVDNLGWKKGCGNAHGRPGSVHVLLSTPCLSGSGSRLAGPHYHVTLRAF